MIRTRRRAASALTTLALFATLLLSGCASTGSTGVASLNDGKTPTGTTEPDATSSEGDGVKFAECMREHGIDVPDPETENGGAVQFTLPRDGGESAMREARDACKEFLPNGGEPMKLDPEQLAEAREFSKCMRENGIEDFPDPNADGGIMIEGDALEVDEEFDAAQEACSEHLPDDDDARRRSSGGDA